MDFLPSPSPVFVGEGSRQPAALLHWKQLALVLQSRNDQPDPGRAKSILLLYLQCGNPFVLFLAVSYGKIDSLPYGLSGSTLLSHGSCCGLISSIVSFPFFALVLSLCVSMCRAYRKHFRSGSSSWEAPRLDLFAKLHNDLPVTLIHFENRGEDRK